MKIISTKFRGLKIIKSKTFQDSRGFFKEIYKKKNIKKNNLVFSCMSSSKKNVLRGLHLQTKFGQGKYLTVIKGKILDVAVDLRKNSKTFSKHFKIVLSDKINKSIFVPAGFAHGFLSLKKESIIYYLCSNYRSPKNEVGLLWNDKDLKIKWSIKKPILSKKDKKNMTFKKFKKNYL